MPRKGFSSITVRDDLKNKLEKRAVKMQISVPETIENLLECATEA